MEGDRDSFIQKKRVTVKMLFWGVMGVIAST